MNLRRLFVASCLSLLTTSMLCIAVVLPIMGAAFDKAGAGAALRTVAVLPVILTVIFGLLFVHYGAKGGYRAVKLDAKAAA